SKGIRRIVALTGLAASAASKVAENLDSAIDSARKSPDVQLAQGISAIQKILSAPNVPLRAKRRGQAAVAELQTKLKALEKSQKQSAGATIDIAAISSKLLAEAEALGGGQLIVGEVAGASDEQLRGAMDSLRKKSPSHGILLGSASDGKVNFV